MKFKLIIFDLDNTLYDENTYFRSVFLTFCKKYNFPIKSIETVLDNQSRIYEKDIFKTFLELLPCGFSKQLHEELFFLYCSLEIPLKLYEDAWNLLNFLQKKEILFAILTNGPIQAQKNKIKNLGLKNYPVFYAREFGKEYEKPNPLAFQRVLKYFNVEAGLSIFVGDNPKNDIIGSQKVGMCGVWLRRGYASLLECNEAKYAITNLNKLKELIEKGFSGNRN